MILFCTLLLAGLVFAPGAAAQSPRTLTIVAQALNVRSGPGVAYAPLDILFQGEQLPIAGQDAATGWWQVTLPQGGTGWVSGHPAYVSVSDEMTSTQVVTATQPITSTTGGGVFVFQATSGGPIYAVNPDGSNLRYLTTGLDPALSPDGWQVAFARWNTSQDGALGSLWVINVDGTGERLLMTNVHNPRTPAWSPDGSQIALSMQHGGWVQPKEVCGGGRPPRDAYDVDPEIEGYDDKIYCYMLPPRPEWGLRLLNVATGAYEDLPHDRYSLSPAWDTGRIIYDGAQGLVSLNVANRANIETIGSLTTDVNDHSPAFSPDGSKIAVSYWQHDHWEIHTLNADGSGRMRLTQTSYQTWVEQELSGQPVRSYNNGSPAWSPDGVQIAFVTDRTGQWEIWVMNVDGSNQRPMFPPGALAGITLDYNGVDEQMLAWR
jgi:uncharacterized protein YraI